jgi:hypothetical protein
MRFFYVYYDDNSNWVMLQASVHPDGFSIKKKLNTRSLSQPYSTCSSTELVFLAFARTSWPSSSIIGSSDPTPGPLPA